MALGWGEMCDMLEQEPEPHWDFSHLTDVCDRLKCNYVIITGNQLWLQRERDINMMRVYYSEQGKNREDVMTGDMMEQKLGGTQMLG